MARRALKKSATASMPMAKPDRSGPDPTQETLLDIAERRGLLNKAQEREDELRRMTADDTTESPPGRFAESILWSISLAFLHFTFDILVQNQYAEEISWGNVFIRDMQAFVGMLAPQIIHCKKLTTFNISLPSLILYPASSLKSINTHTTNLTFTSSTYLFCD
jgi:hypothetical protein